MYNFEKTAENLVLDRDILRFDNLSYGKYSNNFQENRQFQHIQNNYQRKSIDAAAIKQELNANIKDLAYQFLGKPDLQKTTEWRYGNKGSISVHVAGTKQGLYSNFETGESGSALKLIQDQLGCDHKQAFKWGVEWVTEGRLQNSEFRKYEIFSPRARPEDPFNNLKSEI